METQTIDKLFLELSQITKARTENEIILSYAVERAFKAGLSIGNSPNFKMSQSDDEWARYREYHLQELPED